MLGDAKLQIDIDVNNATNQLQLIVLIVGISNELFPVSRKGDLPPTGQGKGRPHTRSGENGLKLMKRMSYC
jgi:hypothetical protein